MKGGNIMNSITLLLRSMEVAKKSTKKVHQNIGARLADLRRQRGLTQKDLAARVGVEQPFISNYERGELRLHSEVILQIADVLKVSTDELLGRKKIKNNSSPKSARLLKRMERIDQLSATDRRAVLKYLDTLCKTTNSKKA